MILRFAQILVLESLRRKASRGPKPLHAVCGLKGGGHKTVQYQMLGTSWLSGPRRSFLHQLMDGDKADEFIEAVYVLAALAATLVWGLYVDHLYELMQRKTAFFSLPRLCPCTIPVSKACGGPYIRKMDNFGSTRIVHFAC